MNPSSAAILPLVILVLAIDTYCLIDIYKHNSSRYLPRWAWAIIVLGSFPLGAICYLILAKKQNDS
ncbi:PLDc N-terminal domain-containing protein [Candidatus Saccharibacteria bacterium]|nr:PLDc N-terminal domain-containing protein [Candidatus Saccharibacteria bacterium]